MANLEAADTRLSFDDILEAVQDSRRGRWFLQEYESRLQKRDSQSILQAINRLENRMEAMGTGGQSSPDEMARVRNAIANARNDLLKLGLGKDAMSKEGRLFAEIADLARKSMPVAVDSNAGIVRTLQLADEIEAVIATPSTIDKGAQYFAADAALFERAPVSKPALVVAETAVAAAPVTEPARPAATKAEPVPVKTEPAKADKKEEPAPVGARLVIRKASQVETPAAEAASAPVIEQPAEPAVAESKTNPPEQVPLPAAELPAMDNPRIVIIRRKAEDMPEVDLAPRQETTSAA